MKNLIRLSVLGMLCLNFPALAQRTAIKAVGIGGTVPDLPLKNIRNYTKANARLSDFKGKLVIIDFWATWCSPCIAMIPRMDSLQKEFGEHIQFLSVTSQTRKEVDQFQKRRFVNTGKGMHLPEITDDEEIRYYFPHHLLPHYVWLDGERRVVAITDHADVNSANIVRLLGKKEISLTEKVDVKVPYDNQKPLLAGGNGGSGKTLIYHSLLSSYLEGVQGGLLIAPPDSNGSRRITQRNAEPVGIFQLAFRDKGVFGANRTVLEGIDSAGFIYRGKEKATDWFRQHALCYDLMVPKAQASRIFDYFRDDLQRYFPELTTGLEKRERKYLALVRTTKDDKLATKGGPAAFRSDAFSLSIQNRPFSILVLDLSNVVLRNSVLPLVDESGYKGRVDVTLNGNISNVETLNTELARYGLSVREKTGPLEVLVIRRRSGETP